MAWAEIGAAQKQAQWPRLSTPKSFWVFIADLGRGLVVDPENEAPKQEIAFTFSS